MELSSDLVCELVVSGRGWGDDTILCQIFNFHDSKVELRSVASHWRQIVEGRYPKHQKFDPPEGGQCIIEIEEDLQMNKLIYCATLHFSLASTSGLIQELRQQQQSSPSVQESAEDSETRKNCKEGYVSCDKSMHSSARQEVEASRRQAGISKVAFTNWVPSYYRSNANDDREVVHVMEETDAIATWILVTKLLRRDACGAGGDAASSDRAHGSTVETQLRGDSCIACSGRGFNCRLCQGTGLRENAGPGGSAAAVHSSAYHSFLWVRSNSHGPSFSDMDTNAVRTWELAKKHPLTPEEVGKLQALLDYRRNPRLLRKERATPAIVPFGGVSKV
eukprot:TRINITY_DN52711_c0_g1_i1.p1 TRINITY_DN52711_c0_g1~~TRINITY_DN52711_c0_g1_i1.p1  ORF type:complete len:334 (+),score=48.79 TRINITY_DN52711_c0_g1_i1:36-1037(+)